LALKSSPPLGPSTQGVGKISKGISDHLAAGIPRSFVLEEVKAGAPVYRLTLLDRALTYARRAIFTRKSAAMASKTRGNTFANTLWLCRFYHRYLTKKTFILPLITFGSSYFKYPLLLITSQKDLAYKVSTY
jgi:hypothetical protein